MKHWSFGALLGTAHIPCPRGCAPCGLIATETLPLTVDGESGEGIHGASLQIENLRGASAGCTGSYFFHSPQSAHRKVGQKPSPRPHMARNGHSGSTVKTLNGSKSKTIEATPSYSWLRALQGYCHSERWRNPSFESMLIIQ